MNIHLTKSQIGLDGVPAAETVLSHVDGERGELIIAGEHVGTLAAKSSFEGVTARLWNGATGSTLSEANVRANLGAVAVFSRVRSRLRADQAAADIGVERGRRDRELGGGLPGREVELIGIFHIDLCNQD